MEMSIGLVGLPGTPPRTRGPKSLPSRVSGQRQTPAYHLNDHRNPDSLITVKNSLIAQSNSLFNA
jgi:hypothetical protein